MGPFLEIARTGLAAILLHPLRNLVVTAALVGVLLPYLAGLGVSQGVREDAENSLRFGADLYVTGTQFGRSSPVPAAAAGDIQKVEGVTEVIPRVVGAVALGQERWPAVVVGVPLQRFPPSVSCVEGRLYAGTGMNELVVGSELARRLGLHVGSLLPPFYASRRGDHTSRVVGIFQSDVSLWQARLIFTSLETATAIFDQEGLATDFLVYCRPGYQASIRTEILQTLSLTGEREGGIRPRVTSREELQALMPQRLLHREGIFNLHFLLAFAVGIGVLLVTSGFGLSERRREIAILKATGWQTDEVLLRSLVESFLLSLTGASLAVVLAYVWLECLNGYWVASIFLAGVDMVPAFKVPFRLTPVPVLLSFLVSFVLTMSGTVYSSWRAATVPPLEALR